MSNKRAKTSSDKSRRSDGTLQIDRSLIEKQLRGAGNASHKTPCFVVLGGLDVGSIIVLDKPKMILGRDTNCDFVLRDDGISRHHIEVLASGDDRVSVRDVGSTNGIFVHGKKVATADLQDGDKILLGRRTVLKFVLQDELEQSYQRQIYESSTCDGLTGVYNRKYFNQKIATDLSFAHRHRMPFTLLMLDIDLFKKIVAKLV